jgi:rhamnosyltransferase
MRIPRKMLGQSGCRLEFPGVIVYVDPYLSDSVKVLHSSDLERLVPIAIEPHKVTDADIVLITHEHIDHCDPHSLPQISVASPQARFIGPEPVIAKLMQWGISNDRLILASESWHSLTADLQVHAIPAAHPEIQRDVDGNLTAVGYLLDYSGKKLYLAGDTFARQDILDILNQLGPVDIAFLPVNEHNFFRGRLGIIGNMSVREAFQFATEIGAKQVVALHWDMFAINSVDPDEIRLIHQRTKQDFDLLISPTHLNFEGVQATIVIRTLNEARYLDELLDSIANQETDGLCFEVVLVDSGSSDDTVRIAQRRGCRILHINREEFSFGRSLNLGCDAALGDILVITSGHCIPCDKLWLQKLCRPLRDGKAAYVYGRQVGGTQTQYSERRIFAQYFQEHSNIPQTGYYCNNANSALLKSVWSKYRFDEELTGLEYMELAQRLVKDGGKIGYVAEAAVYHHHAETWHQVRRRFEREAIALQRIMPQIHVSFLDTIRYTTSSIVKDWRTSRNLTPKVKFLDIVRYRWSQYFGVYKGNHQHRKLSNAEKEKYFFPE